MIKISRRHFLGCCAVSIGAGGIPATPSFGQTSLDFVCSTDIPLIEGDVSLQNSDGEGGLDAAPQPGTGEGGLTPQGSARREFRWLERDGFPGKPGVIWLGVGFVRNYSSAWKNEVRDRAMEWLPPGSPLARRIFFDFTVPLDRCHIRIAQTGVDGLKRANRSLLGRLARNNRLDGGPATMEIADLISVPHEFGHALCLTHEHFHDALPITIDREKAIEYFGRKHEWSAAKTVANLFAPSERCVGDPGWNATSVMGYSIPAEITKEGVGLSKTHKINERDRRCANGIYGVS